MLDKIRKDGSEAQRKLQKDNEQRYNEKGQRVRSTKLLTSPLTSLAEFKKESLRVDRWLKNTVKNMPSTTKLF